MTAARGSGTGRLYRQVAERLRARIAANDYPLDQRLPAERDLAAEFAVSRPTVREAIIMLELDGLVEVRNGSGAYVVSQVPLSSIVDGWSIGTIDLLEARLAIESAIAAVAAQRISPQQLLDLRTLVAAMEVEIAGGRHGYEEDRAFHVRIAEATRNPALVKIAGLLWDLREGVARPGDSLLPAEVDRARDRITDHRAIVRALESGDAVAARLSMRSHLSRVLDWTTHSDDDDVEDPAARRDSQIFRSRNGEAPAAPITPAA